VRWVLSRQPDVRVLVPKRLRDRVAEKMRQALGTGSERKGKEAMPKYDHIIWDWNGTLFDDAELCVQILNGVLSRRARPTVTHAQYMQVFGFPVRDYYRRLGLDFSSEPFETIATEWMSEYQRRRCECGLQPHARAVLGACCEAGLDQSILSAYSHDALEEVVTDCGLRAFFTALVGLGDHYADSKLENGRRFMAERGLAGKRVAFVGDTIHDFEVARALGLDCALIPSGHHTRDRLESCGVPLLDGLREVLGFVGVSARRSLRPRPNSEIATSAATPPSGHLPRARSASGRRGKSERKSPSRQTDVGQ